MALVDESNLFEIKARMAKFRTSHCGTKLNKAELHEFSAPEEKRTRTLSGSSVGRVEEARITMHCEGKFHRLATSDVS